LLIFALPGRAARELKKKFADIITRYFAGAKSLVSEINANAASTGPIAQMARSALEDASSGGGLPANPPVFTQELRFAEDSDQVPTAAASVYTDEELVKNPPAAVVNLATGEESAGVFFLRCVERISTQTLAVTLAAKEEVIETIKRVVDAKDQTISAKDEAINAQQEALMVMRAVMARQ